MHNFTHLNTFDLSKMVMASSSSSEVETRKASVNLARLGNSILLMSNTVGDYSQLDKLSKSCAKLDNRKKAVRWLKEVAVGFKMSSDSRDSAIQIFDKFMSVMLPENIEADTDFISYAVAVSIVISSKLHESRRRLSLLSFQDFRIDLLKHFERLILSKIGLSIAPQITPTAFVVELLILWQPNSQYPPPCPKNFGYGFFYSTIIEIADSLIAAFWEESSSLLFAPSTVAIAALILSFSILKMDCSEWLRSIPNFFLPLNDNPMLNSSSDTRLFDIDSCLQSFQKSQIIDSLTNTPEPKGDTPEQVITFEPVLLASTIMSVDLIAPKEMSKSRNATAVTPQKDLITRKRSLSTYNEDEIYATIGQNISPATDSESVVDSAKAMKMKKSNEDHRQSLGPPPLH